MSTSQRQRRVAEVLKNEIAGLLTRGIKDPRVGFVSIMEVRMSKDLRYASVYVSLFGDDKAKKSSMIALRNSAPWMRGQLGRKIGLYTTPEIRFFEDTTLDSVYHLEEVIQQIHDEETENAGGLTDEQGKEEAEGPKIMNTNPLELLSAFAGHESFLVVSHLHPDGDALGSTFALSALLRALGKQHVYCANHDPVPALYQWLPGSNHLLSPDAIPSEVDAVIILDAAHYHRLGEVADHLPKRVRTYVIDHHQVEAPVGDMNWISPEHAAVGSMIAELFLAAKIPFDRDTATQIYVAMATDTGGFRFSNTTARTHELAAYLLAAGVDVADVTLRVFERITQAKFGLMRRLFDRMELHGGGQVAITHVLQSDMKELGAGNDDLEGLVNYGRNIEHVKVGILICEVTPTLTKVSLRSEPDFNSATALEAFGGGGHAAAAGATIEKPADEVASEILSHVLRLLGAE